MAALSDLFATVEDTTNIRCHNNLDTITYGKFPIEMLKSNKGAVKAILRQGGYFLDNDRVGKSVNSNAIARHLADIATGTIL